MKTINLSLSAFLIFLLAFSTLPVQAKLYKWVDEEGKVHYSDKVPPQHSKHKRDVLNKRGMTVKKIEAAKTAEQLIEEEKQAKIREEQKRKDEKQATYDQMLLNSYLSEEGLINTRDAKVTAISNIIQASNNTLRNQEKRLMDLKKAAANYERGDKPIPKSTLKQIKDTQEQIQKTHGYIANKQVEQESIRVKYEKDIQRYRKLKGNSISRTSARSN